MDEVVGGPVGQTSLTRMWACLGQDSRESRLNERDELVDVFSRLRSELLGPYLYCVKRGIMANTGKTQEDREKDAPSAADINSIIDYSYRLASTTYAPPDYLPYPPAPPPMTNGCIAVNPNIDLSNSYYLSLFNPVYHTCRPIVEEVHRSQLYKYFGKTNGTSLYAAMLNDCIKDGLTWDGEGDFTASCCACPPRPPSLFRKPASMPPKKVGKPAILSRRPEWIPDCLSDKLPQASLAVDVGKVGPSMARLIQEIDHLGRPRMRVCWSGSVSSIERVDVLADEVFSKGFLCPPTVEDVILAKDDTRFSCLGKDSSDSAKCMALHLGNNVDVEVVIHLASFTGNSVILFTLSSPNTLDEVHHSYNSNHWYLYDPQHPPRFTLSLAALEGTYALTAYVSKPQCIDSTNTQVNLNNFIKKWLYKAHNIPLPRFMGGDQDLEEAPQAKKAKWSDILFFKTAEASPPVVEQSELPGSQDGTMLSGLLLSLGPRAGEADSSDSSESSSETDRDSDSESEGLL